MYGCATCLNCRRYGCGKAINVRASITSSTREQLASGLWLASIQYAHDDLVRVEQEGRAIEAKTLGFLNLIALLVALISLMVSRIEFKFWLVTALLSLTLFAICVGVLFCYQVLRPQVVIAPPTGGQFKDLISIFCKDFIVDEDMDFQTVQKSVNDLVNQFTGPANQIILANQKRVASLEMVKRSAFVSIALFAASIFTIIIGG